MPSRFICFYLLLLVLNTHADFDLSSIPLKKVSVGEILQSDQSISLKKIKKALESVWKMPPDQIQQVESLVRERINAYQSLARVTLVGPSALEVAPLTTSEQFALESIFDENLIKICGATLALRVKYYFVRLLFIETGAFGKHSLLIEWKDSKFIVSAGPLNQVSQEQGKLIFHPGLLDKITSKQ